VLDERQGEGLRQYRTLRSGHLGLRGDRSDLKEDLKDKNELSHQYVCDVRVGKGNENHSYKPFNTEKNKYRRGSKLPGPKTTFEPLTLYSSATAEAHSSTRSPFQAEANARPQGHDVTCPTIRGSEVLNP